MPPPLPPRLRRRRSVRRRCRATLHPPTPPVPAPRSGGNVDLERAKRLGGHGLRLVLSTHLGMLCTGLAGGGLLAAVTLATKALFLGQLSATESSQLTEVGAG